MNSASRKLQRKKPIKRFPDGEIRRWSAQKEKSEAIEISRHLSLSHVVDGTPKGGGSTDDDSGSPSPSQDTGVEVMGLESGGLEGKVPHTPPLVRCQMEHGTDSATSSDECETEEEMRSLPPNQVREQTVGPR